MLRPAVSIYILANCERFLQGFFFLWLGIGKGVIYLWRDMFKKDCLLLLRGIKNIPTSPIGSFLYVQAEM